MSILETANEITYLSIFPAIGQSSASANCLHVSLNIWWVSGKSIKVASPSEDIWRDDMIGLNGLNLVPFSIGSFCVKTIIPRLICLIFRHEVICFWAILQCENSLILVKLTQEFGTKPNINMIRFLMRMFLEGIYNVRFRVAIFETPQIYIVDYSLLLSLMKVEFYCMEILT